MCKVLVTEDKNGKKITQMRQLALYQWRKCNRNGNNKGDKAVLAKIHFWEWKQKEINKSQHPGGYDRAYLCSLKKPVQK